MPVDFERYRPNELPEDATNGRRILEFLAENPDLGYRPSELSAELDIPRGSVGTTLRRLEERGFVRHKGEYWALDPEGFDAQSAAQIGLQTVSAQFEGDYYDRHPEWADDLPDVDEGPEESREDETE